MKNKIANKLTRYFGVLLVVMSLCIGGVFYFLFNSHVRKIHRGEMTEQGQVIAEALVPFLEQTNTSQMGFGGYIRALNSVSIADTWIFDRNQELITQGQSHTHGHRMRKEPIEFKEIPKDAESAIRDAYKGSPVIREKNNGIFSEPTIIVAIPVLSQTKEVIGLVLMYSSIDGTRETISSGMQIIGISLLVGFCLAAILSYFLSRAFTQSLSKINQTTKELMKGNYSIKTGVEQEDEIGELAQAIDSLSVTLYEAEEESKRIEKMKGDFVANISHELKTPITVIRGYLELLVDDVIEDRETMKEYHQQILQETIFLQKMVGDLLDLSKLQSYEFSIEQEKVDSISLIRDINRSLKPLAEMKNIKIEIIQEEEMLPLRGDYARLRQLLIIVLDNAIKFSPENGQIAVHINNQRIKIHDSGKGVVKEDLAYIFDRFHKARDERNKKGTGLGLPIAKEIAKKHNMDLTMENDHGAVVILNWEDSHWN